jgi:hypothetical protein
VSDTERTKALEILQTSLSNLENKLDGRKVEDIRKRLDMLKSKWLANELPQEVQRGMSDLANHLENGNHDEADKAQKKLMVDWPSQCSNWLVGIRQIVFESRAP